MSLDFEEMVASESAAIFGGPQHLVVIVGEGLDDIQDGSIDEITATCIVFEAIGRVWSEPLSEVLKEAGFANTKCAGVKPGLDQPLR